MSKKPDRINVAIIGLGKQGTKLMSSINSLPSRSRVRLTAVCDLQPIEQKIHKHLSDFWKESNFPRYYNDFRQMLDSQKDLHAVIIATPDFCHAAQAIYCMNKGLHVYCEPEMARTIDQARQMVKTADKTGNLLQIGRQKRSDPVYHYCCHKLINEEMIVHLITSIAGQCHRSCLEYQPVSAAKSNLSKKILNDNGYNSAFELLNWRYFKHLSNGPFVYEANHQLDIFRWLLGDSFPVSVIGSGTNNYWHHNQWYDSANAIFEFDTVDGTVRANCQMITTCSYENCYEVCRGDWGTLYIDKGYLLGFYPEYREGRDRLNHHVTDGILLSQLTTPSNLSRMREHWLCLASGGIRRCKHIIPVTSLENNTVYHLKNFFSAIRGDSPLNYSACQAFPTTVMTLKANKAIGLERRCGYNPQEFIA